MKEEEFITAFRSLDKKCKIKIMEIVGVLDEARHLENRAKKLGIWLKMKINGFNTKS